MKLYLNEELAVNKRELVGFFDMDTATVSEHSRSFLRKKEKEGALLSATDAIPTSFVVTAGERVSVYLVRNAPKVLKRRTKRHLL